jgi:uncharacterized membrane protein YidH (DUF202 family)
MNNEVHESDAIAINEVQLLLAEERTSLALMRTGIAVLALPLSVFSVLVATSKYYDALRVLHFLLPLALVCLVLLLFGGYLVIHSLLRIRRIGRLIHQVKLEHSVIARFLDPGP